MAFFSRNRNELVSRKQPPKQRVSCFFFHLGFHRIDVSVYWVTSWRVFGGYNCITPITTCNNRFHWVFFTPVNGVVTNPTYIRTGFWGPPCRCPRCSYLWPPIVLVASFWWPPTSVAISKVRWRAFERFSVPINQMLPWSCCRTFGDEDVYPPEV